jgi:phosphoglycolate phosphatase-like HAD superfamily hydrolase
VSPTILLFDIDGTLIDGRGAGRRAMEAAMAAVIGDGGGLPTMRFAGMTDRAIVRQGLGERGRLDDAPSIVERVLAEYLRRLPEEVAATPGRVLPGVTAVLDALRDRAGIALGLGTGNLRLGAEVKLGAVGLWPRFAFGGFGCDHEDRTELVRIGLRRGAVALGVPREACRAIVVGDTPRDVEAARAAGAQSLAVGTSWYSCAQLQDAGATWTVADLAVPDALSVLLDA